jgi:hypothetical protein
MRDLLAELRDDNISLEEADRILDETIEMMHSGKLPPEWWLELGLSNYEVSAYSQGANLADIVRLRFEGWPTKCSRCGLPIDYRLYGWWFEHSNESELCLRHIECPTIV